MLFFYADSLSYYACQCCYYAQTWQSIIVYNTKKNTNTKGTQTQNRHTTDTSQHEKIYVSCILYYRA